MKIQSALLNNLIISPRAIQKLKSISSPLRISVESGGCNGFQYKMEISNSSDDQDVIFDKEGTRVIVDKISLDYIKGSTLDFSEELIGCKYLTFSSKASFVIVGNPLAGSSCGCKTSFSLK